MFEEAKQMHRMHEDRCNCAPTTNFSSDNQAMKEYRLEQQWKQVELLEYLGFEFDRDANYLNQTSAGYVWLCTQLYELTKESVAGAR